MAVFELDKLDAMASDTGEKRQSFNLAELDTMAQDTKQPQIQPQQQTPAAPQGQPFLSSQNEKPFIPGAEQATADDADLMTLADRVGKTDEWGNNFLYQFGKGALAGGMNVASGLAGLVNVATGDNKFTRTIADTLTDAANELARSKEFNVTDSEYWTNPEGLFYGLGNLVGSSAGLGTLASGFGWAAGKAAKAAMPYFTKLASKSPFAAKVMEKMTPIKELYSNWQANHGKLNAAGRLLAGQLYGAPFDAGANAGSVGNEWLQEHPGDVDGARDVAFKAFMAELPVDFLNAVVGLAGLYMNPLTSKAAIKPLAKDIAAGTAAYISVAKDIAKMAGYTALDSVSEGYQESVQDLSGRYAKGEVSLSRAYNPILWDEKDWNTFGTVAIENAIIGGLGGAANTAADIIDDTTTGKINREALGESKANIAATDDNIIQKEEKKDEKSEDDISLRKLQDTQNKEPQPVEEQEGNGGQGETQVIQKELANAPADKVKYYQEGTGDDEENIIIPKEFFDAKIANAKSLKAVDSAPEGMKVYELIANNGQKYYASIDMGKPAEQAPIELPKTEQPKAEQLSTADENLRKQALDVGTIIRTDTGKAIPYSVELLDADQIITSNDHNTFQPNPNYPKQYQPRDRAGVTMQKDVITRAQNLDPSRLMNSDMVNTGAPVVLQGENGYAVLNGNGRAMSIKRVLQENGEKAQAYREAMADYLAKGDAEKKKAWLQFLQERPNSILVRRALSQGHKDEISDIINSTAGGMTMSAAETAQNDANLIDDSVWSFYKPNDDGDLTSSGNKEFVNKVLGKIIEKNPALEQQLYPNGKLSLDGIKRMQNAVFAYAYRDSGTISQFANSGNTERQNIVRGMLRAAPSVAKARSAIVMGGREDLDFVPYLLDACKKMNSIESEAELADYVNSEALFEGGDIGDTAKDILRVLFAKRRSAKAIGDFIDAMATIVQDTIDAEASGALFDDVGNVDINGVVRAATASTNTVLEKKKGEADGKDEVPGKNQNDGGIDRKAGKQNGQATETEGAGADGAGADGATKTPAAPGLAGTGTTAGGITQAATKPQNTPQLKEAIDTGKLSQQSQLENLADGLDETGEKVAVEKDGHKSTDEDFIDYAFNQGGIINTDAIASMSDEDLKLIAGIFDDGNKKPIIKGDKKGKPSVKEEEKNVGRGRGGLQGLSKGASQEPVQQTESGGDAGQSGSGNGGQRRGTGTEFGGSNVEEEPQNASNGSGNDSTGNGERGNVPVQRVRGLNYTITDADVLGEGGAKTKYKNNVAAIELLKQLEKDNRMATPEEQKILAKYVGWGSIPHAFDWNAEKKGWGKENEELKSLLTEEEYEAAKASTVDAFYTPKEVIQNVWNVLDNMGFKGGKVLEPSMGVGNFFGLMPEGIRNKSNLYGVELDNISGSIAKQLYQGANIEVTGFEKVKYPENYFDLVISNVPFGSSKLYDEKYKGKYSVQNFFFAKGLDLVRPGGIVCFITSASTLNDSYGDAKELREMLANRADFLGAVALPNSTFKDNAGTTVTSHLIFLQKLPALNQHNENNNHSEWTKMGDVSVEGRNYSVNKYFTDNPQMVLGKYQTGGRWGQLEIVPKKDANLNTELNNVLSSNLPKDIYKAKKSQMTERQQPKSFLAPQGVRSNTFLHYEGKLYQNVNGEMKEIKEEKGNTLISDFVDLKDALKSVLTAQVDAKTTDVQLSEKRQKLNKEYDKFVKNNGRINEGKNKKKLMLDEEYGLIASIEDYKVNKKTGEVKASKRDIFNKRTVQPIAKVESADNINDALQASYGEKGMLDVRFMARLLNKGTDEVVAELGDRVFFEPDLNDYVERSEYLSGDVKAKLEQAELAAKTDGAFLRNVEELKKVQPKELSYRDIAVQLGSPWVPSSDIEAFANHLMERDGNDYPAVQVRYSHVANGWTTKVGNYVSKNGTLATVTWGTKRRPFIDILDAALNNRTIEVKDDVEIDGKTKSVINVEETELAKTKVKELQDAFANWIWKDEERKARLVDYYNRTFNNWVLRKYDGSFVNPKVHGYNTEAPDLRTHQLNAVARIIQDKNVLIAHGVGAGKTWTMQTAAMELKRLGIAQKSMFVLPKNIVRQFEKEFYSIYPNAKLLVLSSDILPEIPNKNSKGFLNLSKEQQTAKLAEVFAQRQSVLSRIATEDWDGIIISHNLFSRIPMSPEEVQKFYQKQIDIVVDAIKSSDDGMTVKALEKKKKDLMAKLQKQVGEENKKGALNFEQLGVNRIFVDEADMFKNLEFTTRIRNVSGLQNSGSNRSMDMYLKTQWLNNNNGGTIFATGTPISNTLSEMYTMQRYLGTEDLEEHGIEYFDSWASAFTEKDESESERNPDGNGYRAVTKLKFNNLRELKIMFRKFADVVTFDELTNILDIPKLKIQEDGERGVTVVKVPTNPALSNYIKVIAKERSKLIHKGMVKPEVDNMLKLTGDLRKASLDMRLIDPAVPAAEASGKIESAVQTIARVYKEKSDVKGTQLVFCDLSVPKPKKQGKNEEDSSSEFDAEDTENITVYEEIKKRLIELGIPAKEIAFVHDAKNDTQKQEMFEDVNRGDIRVIIGSTGKMGAGTNFQEHLVALHHIDAPWRPRDIEQREGRILRQGNLNKEVEIFTYLTEDSFDANMWEKLKNKAKMINQLMSGNLDIRSMDDVGDNVVTYAEMEALASGNPLMKERTEVESRFGRLVIQRDSYLHNQSELQTKVEKTPARIEYLQTQLDNAKSDAELKTFDDDNFKIEVNGKTYTNEADARSDYTLMLQKFNSTTPTVLMRIGDFTVTGRYIKAGEIVQSPYGGMPYTSTKAEVQIKITGGKNTYYPNSSGFDAVLNAVKREPKRLAELYQNEISALKKELVAAKEELNTPFKYENEFQRIAKRKEELDKIFSVDSNGTGVIANASILTNNENTTGRVFDDVLNEARAAFKGADITPDKENNTFMVRFKGGQSLALDIVDEIIASPEDMERYKAAHGKLPKAIKGVTKTKLTKAGLQAIVQVSTKYGQYGDLFHESFHVAAKMFLSPKQYNSLMEYFDKTRGSSQASAEELAADGYKVWRKAREERRGTLWGKLYQKVLDGCEAVLSIFDAKRRLVNNVFKQMESGELFNGRGNIGSAEAVAFDGINNSLQKQAITSAGTSIRQVPAIMKKVNFKPGTTNIDIGGGAYDDATNFLAEKGVANVVFDPFNRSLEHNTKAFEAIKGKGDTVTVANVLNVIAEKGWQENVVLEAAKAVKDDGVVYFGIYEGDGSGVGKETSKGYQNNLKTQNYVPLVEKHFKNVQRKGNMIVARSPYNTSQYAVWNLSPDVTIAYTGIDNDTDSALGSIVSSPKRTGLRGAYDRGGIKGVVNHLFDELYTDWVDEFHYIDKFDKATGARRGEKLLDRMRMVGALSSGFTNALIEGNKESLKVVEEQINAKLHDVTLKDVLAIVDPKEMDKLYPGYLAKYGMGNDWQKMFGTYLGWRRLLEMSRLHDEAYIQEWREWNKRVEAEKHWAANDGAEATRPEAPGPEPKYKPYKMPKGLVEDDLVNAIDQAPEEFERAANLFYLWNDNILTILERGNIISPETHKVLNTKYKNYCSLMRDFSEESAFGDYLSGLTNGGKGIANVRTTLKRINEEGSERLLLNPLEVAVKACAIAVNRAERNKVAMFAVEKLEQSDYGLIVPVKGESHADPGRCIFTVMFEGKPKAFRCVPELYEPITLMDRTSSGIVVGAAAAAARALRTGATMSPSYIIRNIARDTMQAGVASSNGFVPIVDSIRGAWELANNKELAAEFNTMGVSSFNFYTHREAIQKTLRQLAPKRNVSWKDAMDVFERAFGFEDLSAFIEASTRAGEYYLARKHGKTMMEAALDARRVTIDFSRMGRLGKEANRIIPFFNSTIQGTDINLRLVGGGLEALYDTVTGKNKLPPPPPGANDAEIADWKDRQSEKNAENRRKLRTFVNILRYAVVPAVLLRAVVADEPWYDELDSRIKYSNWVLPNRVIVPMSQEWGLYASLVMATLDNYEKNDKKAYESWLELVRETVVPNMLPTIILPIVEGIANYSFWTGKPLANQRLMKLPPELQAYASTSELSKWLGKQTGIPPVVIDNAVRGYTGTIGTFVLGTAGDAAYIMSGETKNAPAKDWDEMTFIRDFAANNNKLRRYTDEFMEIAKQAEMRKEEYKPYMKGLNSLNRKITDLYKMNRGIDEGKIYPKHTPEFKKQLKDRNNEQIRRLSKRGVEMYGDKIKH